MEEISDLERVYETLRMALEQVWNEAWSSISETEA